jgi:hypothetical protein
MHAPPVILSVRISITGSLHANSGYIRRRRRRRTAVVRSGTVRQSSSRPARVSVIRGGHDRLVAAVAVGALMIAGCGSASSTSASGSSSSSSAATSSNPTAPAPAAAATAAADLGAAETPALTQFPRAGGRSLQQLGKLVKSSLQLGAATGTFTPGTRRFAFALNTTAGGFVYAPTAIYIATRPTAPAQGPFLAPADPMGVAPQYRSRQNTGPGGIAAIYATDLPLPRAGTYALLALTRTPRGLVGAAGEVAVAASSLIPDVGQRPPAITTDTPGTVHGDTTLLTTRLPPEQMASASLARLLGKRPIALLFSTPQLCTSRVCGPVTDVAVQLQHQFGNRVTFIHQEVYVDNQPRQGLRPQLKAFHLRTEPWMFIINRHGIITARLEGAYGTAELARALQAALR